MNEDQLDNRSQQQGRRRGREKKQEESTIAGGAIKKVKVKISSFGVVKTKDKFSIKLSEEN